MNINDFTSAERIIADVTATVGDREFKTGFSRGWYESHVQKALQELAMESRIFKVHQDIEVPQDLQVPMMKGVFDIREIYLYNGSLCEPDKTQVLHWKRLFNNKGNNGGNGYTSRVKDDGSNSADPFLPNQSYHNRNTRLYYGSKFYYNVENGIIMLSNDSRTFPYLKVIYNGLGGEIGDKPVIPRFFERAITDYLEERFYNAMKSRDIRLYRPLWVDADSRLRDYNGAWAKAIKRVKTMDRSQQESMNEYISSMYHK